MDRNSAKLQAEREYADVVIVATITMGNPYYGGFFLFLIKKLQKLS